MGDGVHASVMWHPEVLFTPENCVKSQSQHSENSRYMWDARRTWKTRSPGHPMHEVVEYHQSTQNREISIPASVLELNETGIAHLIGLAKYADDEKTEWWMSWGFASQKMMPSKIHIFRGVWLSKRTRERKEAGPKQLNMPSAQRKSL
jgi:hypothetical protein